MHLRVIIKRNILFGFFLSALIALDIFSIIALSDFSSKYPFDRVLYGNKFKYSFVVLGKSDLYDSTLVKMDNYFLTQNNAKKMIAGNTGYFMGEMSASGWKIYFPMVYFLKESA